MRTIMQYEYSNRPVVLYFLAIFLSACGADDINPSSNTNSNIEDTLSDKTKPSAPDNLRTIAENTTSTTVHLVWDAATDNIGISSYRVIRDGVELTSLTPNTLTYLDTGVQQNTTYQYTVKAFDTANNSETSDILSVDTPAENNILPTVTSTSPTNNASNIAPDLNKIVVSFDSPMDPNTLNNSTFILDNGLTGTVSTSDGDTKANFTPSTPLQRDTTYTATINGAADKDGNNLQGNNQQSYSWSFSTCGSTSTTTYTVTWDAVNDGDLTGYRVYYGTTGQLTKTNADSVDLGDVTSWVLNPAALGILPCETVFVAISAIGSTKAESALSESISETIN